MTTAFQRRAGPPHCFGGQAKHRGSPLFFYSEILEWVYYVEGEGFNSAKGAIMKNKSNAGKKYSKSDLEKIRKRASEIWKGKCQALNTALDDWLQAEREFRAMTGTPHKGPGQYTSEDVARIKVRAQAIRDEKVRSLRTAFDDWIQAEQELQGELNKKIKLQDLFDLWFDKSSDRVVEILKKDGAIQTGAFNDILEQQYIEIMAECMK